MSGKRKHKVVVEFTTDRPCDGARVIDSVLEWHHPVAFKDGQDSPESPQTTITSHKVKRLDRVLGYWRARWDREAAAAYQFPKESRQEMLTAAREALDRYKAKNPPIRADGAGFADLNPSPNQLAAQLLGIKGITGEDFEPTLDLRAEDEYIVTPSEMDIIQNGMTSGLTDEQILAELGVGTPEWDAAMTPKPQAEESKQAENEAILDAARREYVEAEDGARGAVTEHPIIADSTPADGKVHIFQVHNGFVCTKCGKSLAPDDFTVSNALQHMMHKDRCG